MLLHYSACNKLFHVKLKYCFLPIFTSATTMKLWFTPRRNLSRPFNALNDAVRLAKCAKMTFLAPVPL